MKTGRFIHATFLTAENNPEAYKQGQRQAQLSLERYHYICAVVQRAWDYTQFADQDLPHEDDRRIDPSQSERGAPSVLKFDRYRDFSLEPIVNRVHIRPGQDWMEEVDLLQLKNCKDFFQTNYKTREGGIMYAVAEYQYFWPLMMVWRTELHSTGIEEWDALLEQFRQSNYDKEVLPCMFFARVSGCLDPSCPFLHDRDATMRDRAEVLEARRRTLREPQLNHAWELRRRDEFKDLVRNRDNVTFVETAVIRTELAQICYSMSCLKFQVKTDGDSKPNPASKLKLCSRCKFATYCSTSCQTADWKRHKQECRPFEDIVTDDELWNITGERKGTMPPSVVGIDRC